MGIPLAAGALLALGWVFVGAVEPVAAWSAAGQAAEQAGGEPAFLRAMRGGLGMVFLLGTAWLFSLNRRSISWQLVWRGLALQLVFAFIVLKTGAGRAFFSTVNDVLVAMVNYTNAGSSLLFGALTSPAVPVDGGDGGSVLIGAHFAFGVLTAIIFFSSFMAVVYHLGVMQRVVGGMAWLMKRTLGTSGAETTSAAGNIFFGQTEAPLLVRPFIAKMTDSELNTVMTGGFATVAGGAMAGYVAILSGAFPGIAGHLLAASIMAAPAGIVVSKILAPETRRSESADGVQVQVKTDYANVIDAAAGGAGDGMKLTLNVAASLLAFMALIAMMNGMLGWATNLVGFEPLTLEQVFGWVFAPIAWVIGVPWSDAVSVGTLFGVKMVANEFVAFAQFGDALSGGAPAAGTVMTEKGRLICAYALTGFANFSSIAIQIGGIGGIAPDRRSDLARLGLRAMLGGTAATWMTATLAGAIA